MGFELCTPGADEMKLPKSEGEFLTWYSFAIKKSEREGQQTQK